MHRMMLSAAVVLLPALAAAAPLRLTVAPGSEVRFRVDAPLDFIPGFSSAVAGWAEVDPAAPGAARGLVTVDLASFDTGVDLRNEDLRDQFFEADKFKEATLRLDGLEHPSAAVLARGRELRAQAVGALSLHGVERQVRFPVVLRLEEAGERSTVGVDGTFSLLLQDFGIQRPSRLFLKVGESAVVTIHASFATTPPPVRPEHVPVAVAAGSLGPRGAAPSGAAPPLLASVAGPRANAPLPKAGPAAAPPRRPAGFLPLGRVARTAPGADAAFRFAYDTAEGRGERLFRDASLGGPGNAVSCANCHAAADERWGLVVDGQIRPNRSVFGSAGRPALWQGLAPRLGKAASICAKLFMLRPEGLDGSREADLSAYLARLGADPAPPLDYRVLALTRRSDLPSPLGGEAARGKVLEQRFCGGCHSERGIRSPLTPGLYEPDDLVRRVRWLPGTDAHQMPPIYVDRLPDTDLRDIVTYLAGDASQRVFKRRR